MSTPVAPEHATPPSTTPPSPALRHSESAYFHTSTPNYQSAKKQHPPLNVSLPTPSTPPIYGEPTLTPPPRSPGVLPACGDGRSHHPDGTSSDKSSEAAACPATCPRSPVPSALSRKESYKAQRQHYRREKKRATSALLHSIEDPSVPLLADWLKVRGSLKSWTKLWCVLKPGLLLLYKSPKAKSSHWVGTVLLTSCQVIERPSKKDGFCFKLYHPLEQSIWAPRGPHNETIGAVVQPLPTAHLIFRAPSPAAGHCWLDGLELALRTTSAMLRCVARVEPDAPSKIDHEDLERHFNEHELAGAASDSDSDAMARDVRDGDTTRDTIVARFRDCYVEDQDREIGAAGELVEEVAEENKSLLWFLLKQVRPGMDLSKVVLPTFVLEPRSFLDKLADNYYHADILAQATTLEDPYARFKTVLKWYLSGLYKKPKGLKKPYNPVLGECFRCCWKHSEDSYTIYIAEQVSHHPPISAFYVSNRKEGFVIEGSLLARSKFYGNSTSAILEGCMRVYLPRWKETYIMTAPYAHCKGIVVGTLSMELGGKVQVLCQESGYHADVEFKLRSFLGSSEQTNAISGRVKKGKDTVATVDGYWDGKIDYKDKKTGEEATLLDVSTLKEQRLCRYLMKPELQQEFESQRLWSKVSEAIMKEDQVAATEQKTIIEEGQRERARSGSARARFFRLAHTVPPDGIIDQGWRYIHVNTNPWESDEFMEYEEEFIVRSVRCATSPPGGSRALPGVATVVGAGRDVERTDSDSDRRETRSVPAQRTLKQTLYAIDTALREQTQAIERLSKNVQNMSERQTSATYRPQNAGRLPLTNQSWNLLLGIMLAMLFQALLKWVFQH